MLSSLLTSLFLISDILLCFETKDVHNAIVVKTEAKFRILSPVKVAGACHYGWARCQSEISGFTYDRTSSKHLIGGLSEPLRPFDVCRAA